jgi:MscS family membrane protein
MINDLLNDLFGDSASDVRFRLSLALAILLLTWLVTRIVRRLLVFVSRQLGRTKATADDRLVQAFYAPVRFIVVIGGLWLALGVADLSTRARDVINQVFYTLILLALFSGVYRSVDVLVDTLEGQRERLKRLDPNVTRFTRQIVKALVLIFAFVIIMQEFGYNLATLVAGLGIGGLAIALAAQDALSNLIGYFVIMADSPFQVGDHIVVKDAEGVVEGIGFRTTRIRKFDQSLVFVPNSIIAGNSVTNWSRLGKRRLEVTLHLARATSPEQILGVVNSIRATLNNNERLVKDSAIVQFAEIKDNTPQLHITAYFSVSRSEAFLGIKQDINLQIMQILNHYRVALA